MVKIQKRTYRNGYNGIDLKSIVSAPIRHGGSNPSVRASLGISQITGSISGHCPAKRKNDTLCFWSMVPLFHIEYKPHMPAQFSWQNNGFVTRMSPVRFRLSALVRRGRRIFPNHCSNSDDRYIGGTIDRAVLLQFSFNTYVVCR